MNQQTNQAKSKKRRLSLRVRTKRFTAAWRELPEEIRKPLVRWMTTALVISVLAIAFGASAWLLPKRKVTVKGPGVTFTADAEEDAKRARKAAESAEGMETKIAEIGKRIERQRDTIDAAFQNATAALRVSKDAQATVVTLSNAVHEAKDAFDALKEESEFMAKVRRASASFATDYDALKKIIGPSGRGAEAFNALMEINRNYWNVGQTFRPYGRLPSQWDAEKVTLQEIEQGFSSLYYVKQEETVMWVHEKAKYPQQDKLKFFCKLNKQDPNLVIRALAGLCLREELKISDDVSVLAQGLFEDEYRKRFPETTAVTNP